MASTPAPCRAGCSGGGERCWREAGLTVAGLLHCLPGFDHLEHHAEGVAWASVGAPARTTTAKTLRNSIRGTQEVDDHGKGLVRVLLVDPVGAPLEDHALEVLQPGGGQLAP